ncbi:unnamed protein product [Echinostoma caproni]|uniref:PH domain-containing protein n=1 Tax=Echinostoma caproni TaxID=27848 RepID=A0A183B8J5_9TREM|nr:unnamed protein product [Echinostoma caproni]
MIILCRFSAFKLRQLWFAFTLQEEKQNAEHWVEELESRVGGVGMNDLEMSGYGGTGTDPKSLSIGPTDPSDYGAPFGASAFASANMMPSLLPGFGPTGWSPPPSPLSSRSRPFWNAGAYGGPPFNSLHSLLTSVVGMFRQLLKLIATKINDFGDS